VERCEDNIKNDLRRNRWMRFCGSVFSPVAVLSEDGNELSGSIKCRGFLVFLRNYNAFKDYAPRIGPTVVLGWPY